MKQAEIPADIKINIDFKRPGIPFTADVLQPVIFKDGDKYGCVLGPDINTGISGFGDSPEKAIQEWDENLSRRIKLEGENDRVIKDAVEKLKEHEVANSTAEIGKPEYKEAIIHTATSEPQEENNKDESAEKRSSRKYTADKSNIDGSEFR